MADNTLMYIALGIGGYLLYTNFIAPNSAAAAVPATSALPATPTTAVTPVTTNSGAPAQNGQQPMNGQGWNTRQGGAFILNGNGHGLMRQVKQRAPLPPTTQAPYVGNFVPIGTRVSVPPGGQLPGAPANATWVPISMNGTAVQYELQQGVSDSGGIMASAQMQI